MKSPHQKHLEFDMATLTTCISNLKPKPIQTLFRGLLMVAALEPRHVTDIDTDGSMMMVATYEVLGRWAGVSARTMERNRELAVNRQLVQHWAGKNFRSQWLFKLTDVLPESSIEWFRDVVENGRMSPRQNDKMSPRHSENVAPTKRKCRPDILQTAPRHFVPPGVPNVGATFSNPSSYCFSLNTASLAKLAEELGKFGFTVQGDTWERLHVDHGSLTHPECLEAIFRAAVATETISDTELHRRGFFAAAVSAGRKENPWRWFQDVVSNGWHLTSTSITKADRSRGELLMQLASGVDAEQLMPAMTGEQAWSRVQETLRKYPLMHQTEQIREALGPEIHAAARKVGLGRIANADQRTTAGLKAELTAAWEDVLRAHEITGQRIATPRPAAELSTSTETPETEPRATGLDRRRIHESVAAGKAAMQRKLQEAKLQKSGLRSSPPGPDPES